MAASRPFDLLLVDLQLPDTGTDVIRSVRGASAAPFILISGFLSTEITVDAMKLGAIDVVEKPISVDELPAHVVISARFTQIATHPTCRRARRHASQRPPDSKPAARIAATVNRPCGIRYPVKPRQNAARAAHHARRGSKNHRQGRQSLIVWASPTAAAPRRAIDTYLMGESRLAPRKRHVCRERQNPTKM